jgi:hypothetical protein
MRNMKLSWADYKRDFRIMDQSTQSDVPAESLATAEVSRAEKALHVALDIRKFEIGLYWTRAAYFWTFIGVSLAAYGTELNVKDTYPKKAEILLVISCVGLVFSVAWYFVNRASKFWQENWEKHVDLLEDPVIGPLYKTVIEETKIRGWRLLDPYPFSVSKQNQILSLFVVVIFIFMTIAAVLRGCSSYRVFPFPWFAWIVILFSGFFIFALFKFGRTNRILQTPDPDPNVIAQRRTTRLVDRIEKP